MRDYDDVNPDPDELDRSDYMDVDEDAELEENEEEDCGCGRGCNYCLMTIY